MCAAPCCQTPADRSGRAGDQRPSVKRHGTRSGRRPTRVRDDERSQRNHRAAGVVVGNRQRDGWPVHHQPGRAGERIGRGRIQRACSADRDGALADRPRHRQVQRPAADHRCPAVVVGLRQRRRSSGHCEPRRARERVGHTLKQRAGAANCNGVLVHRRRRAERQRAPADPHRSVPQRSGHRERSAANRCCPGVVVRRRKRRRAAHDRQRRGTAECVRALSVSVPVPLTVTVFWLIAPVALNVSALPLTPTAVFPSDPVRVSVPPPTDVAPL